MFALEGFKVVWRNTNSQEINFMGVSGIQVRLLGFIAYEWFPSYISFVSILATIKSEINHVVQFINSSIKSSINKFFRKKIEFDKFWL